MLFGSESANWHFSHNWQQHDSVISPLINMRNGAPKDEPTVSLISQPSERQPIRISHKARMRFARQLRAALPRCFWLPGSSNGFLKKPRDIHKERLG